MWRCRRTDQKNSDGLRCCQLDHRNVDTVYPLKLRPKPNLETSLTLSFKGISAGFMDC